MDIQHQPEQQRFVSIPDEQADEAFVTYQLAEPNKVNFNYSFVPPALRGKGVARELVLCAAKWANENNKQISASCGYVALQLKRSGLL